MFARYRLLSGLVLTCGVLHTGNAAAEGLYVAGSVGTVNQDSSSNNGSFTSAFTTGEVTGVSPPLTLAAGAGLRWQTEFDSDAIFSGTLGYDYGHVRAELALYYSASNVHRHSGVKAADLDLSAIDSGVLITGNAVDRGSSVASLVSDGMGDIQTTSLMLNGYYEFDLAGDLTPFLGLGIGYAATSVTFMPSGLSVVDDEDSGLAWQALVGVDYAISDSLSFFGNFRYFAAEDATVEVGLLPATLDIENRLQAFEIGLRFSF